MNKASDSPLRLVTPRDRDLFEALDRCPLTVRQLLKLSVTFTYPFTTERRVQERLQHLCAAGRVHRWLYATAGQGALSYYTLTPLSYCLLHGEDAASPSRGAFEPISLSRQPHTQALADALVHLFVCAHSARIAVHDFQRENSLRLSCGEENLFPDGAFRLAGADGRSFAFFLELDNATESIRSQTSIDSWQRKVRFYERYQDGKTERFRVLAITTGGEARVQNLLACAASLARNPQRSLVYVTTLDAFLADPEAVTATCFRNHRKQSAALVQNMSREIPVPAALGIGTVPVLPSSPCRAPLPQV
jgi:hypothetical protein